MTREPFNFGVKGVQNLNRAAGTDEPIAELAHGSSGPSDPSPVGNGPAVPDSVRAPATPHPQPFDAELPLPESLDSSVAPAPVSPETSTEPPKPAARGPARSGFPIWLVVWLGLLGIAGGVGVNAFFLLTRVPPNPDCKPDITKVPESEQLYCIDVAAQAGDMNRLIKGMAMVSRWPKDHAHYTESRRLMTRWSTSVLLLARQKAAQKDTKGAIAIAQKIPSGSPLYRESQNTIAAWKQELNQGQIIYDKVIAALQSENWRLANEQVQALARIPNDQWRSRAKGLRKQIQDEQAARAKLQEARGLADLQAPEFLAEAIALAQQIQPKSYARKDAQKEIGRWSRQLLNMAISDLSQQRPESAITTAELVPVKSALRREAEKLLVMARAQAIVVAPTSVKQPIYQQLWTVTQALATGQRLDAKNPLYQSVQPFLPKWSAQIEDLTRLQLASTIASANQILAYQVAIQHAQTILADRPQRVQAQTLIAHWRKEIQRLEDRPYLARAKQLAAAGTKVRLQAAIAEARKIRQGRALRLEAQTEIAQWQRQLARLEDQIILDRAQKLAQKGQYEQAVQVLEQIGSDRPLYEEAQAELQSWSGELEIAADRKILNEANLLASYKEYGAAIEVASRIGVDRPLYWEAQTAISEWQAIQGSASVPPSGETPPEPNSTQEINIPESGATPAPDPNPAPVTP